MLIVLTPPPGAAVFKRFRLSSGAVIFPDFSKGGRVRVASEAEAAELKSEGWQRDGASAPPLRKRHQVTDTELRRLGMACEFAHFTKSTFAPPASATSGLAAYDLEAGKRIVIDNVAVDGKLATVAHDAEQNGVVIAGVAIDLDELPVDLRGRFESSVKRFRATDADLAAQSRARDAVTRVVREVLARDKFLAATVRERIRARGH
jgi:hypothetical protein